MGDLFNGTQKSTNTSQSDSGPSKFQAPYLQQGFDAAASNYAAAKDTPYYQGPTYAGLSADQQSTLDKMKSYASGQGMTAANQISDVGSNTINATAGQAATNLDRFTALNSTDPTQSNIAGAEQYANSPYINGQIDAASRDVTRNLNENQLPGIDRAASGTGNINSSRAGVAAGIAQRGAADRIGDISATMRGDAYSQGLSRAAADRSAQLGAYGDAASGYSALNTQGIQDLGTGTAAGTAALGQQAAAGATDQADQQGQMDAAMKAWAGDDTRKQDLLQRYMATVGSNQWGQSGTSSGTGTQSTSGNIFGQVAGAAATAASFM